MSVSKSREGEVLISTPKGFLLRLADGIWRRGLSEAPWSTYGESIIKRFSPVEGKEARDLFNEAKAALSPLPTRAK